MTPLVAKTIVVLTMVAWYIIRFRYARRSHRTPVTYSDRDRREKALLLISLSGLGIVPFIYAVTGFPAFADYAFQPALAWLGLLCAIGALVLFRLTHKALGRNWSVSLDLRENHRLVADGIYRLVRHPMYSAFWLWALAQALLLPNWIAGPAGLVGFGILFFGRVSREEQMMLNSFGDEYRVYMEKTYRIIPGIY
ncbi:MAG: protein-S-isoprenylcysteine O-methyltransferase [Xanthobacteraceae bacterium]